MCNKCNCFIMAPFWISTTRSCTSGNYSTWRAWRNLLGKLILVVPQRGPGKMILKFRDWRRWSSRVDCALYPKKVLLIFQDSFQKIVWGDWHQLREVKGESQFLRTLSICSWEWALAIIKRARPRWLRRLRKAKCLILSSWRRWVIRLWGPWKRRV